MSFESVEQSFGWWKHCYLGVGIRPQGRFLFTRRAIKAGELILAERGAHIGRPDAIVAAIAKDPRFLSSLCPRALSNCNNQHLGRTLSLSLSLSPTRNIHYVG